MLLALRILTIFFSLAGFVSGGWLVIAGVLETPAETEAIWLGAGILLYYIADLFLLYKSYKKEHRPTHWVALILAVLPVLLVSGLVFFADYFSD
jgi:hypothetical protein